MNIPKIDKEIIDKFFPDEEFEVGYVTPRKSLREYNFNDGERHLLIGTPRTIEHIGELATMLISKNGVSVNMSKYKGYVVLIITYDFSIYGKKDGESSTQSTSYVVFPETVDLPDESGPTN